MIRTILFTFIILQYIIWTDGFSLDYDPDIHVHHVPAEFPTIQQAIDAAADGDTVLVASGTYTGSGNRDIDFLGKAIVVRSENGPEVTVIDCQGSPHRGFFFHDSESDDSMLKGFSIINGCIPGNLKGNPLPIAPRIITCIIEDNPASSGGGIYCEYSSPTILDCIICDCQASSGAGFYCLQASPVVSNCTFTRNDALGPGGGMYCTGESNPTVSDCVFLDNYARHNGGGIACFESSPSILNCTINLNSSNNNGGGISCHVGSNPVISDCEISDNSCWYWGGGISIIEQSHPQIDDCSIRRNSSHEGGGIGVKYDDPSISGCEIVANSADYGGGMYCTYSDPSITRCIISENTGNGALVFKSSGPIISNCIISKHHGYSALKFNSDKQKVCNCIIADNSGTGVSCMGSYTTFNNCTIASNNDYGLTCNYHTVLLNCIVWDNSNGAIDFSDERPVITCSDIEGGWLGDGNIDADPRFVPFPFHGFEYLLLPNSPCVDTGDPSIEDGLSDWHPRWPDWYPNGVRSDMGAYGGPGNVEWLR